jgi:hypothetical protein
MLWRRVYIKVHIRNECESEETTYLLCLRYAQQHIGHKAACNTTMLEQKLKRYGVLCNTGDALARIRGHCMRRVVEEDDLGREAAPV